MGQSGGMLWQHAGRFWAEAERKQTKSGAMAQSIATSSKNAAF
jgi:hypothetical protein